MWLLFMLHFKLVCLFYSYAFSDIPSSLWAAACVLVDKLDKQAAEAILLELVKLGVADNSAQTLIDTIQVILQHIYI